MNYNKESLGKLLESRAVSIIHATVQPTEWDSVETQDPKKMYDSIVSNDCTITWDKLELTSNDRIVFLTGRNPVSEGGFSYTITLALKDELPPKVFEMLLEGNVRQYELQWLANMLKERTGK